MRSSTITMYNPLDDLTFFRIFLVLFCIFCVKCTSLKEVLSASRVSNMFYADMKSLGSVSISNLLLQQNTDSRFGYIPYNARLSLIDSMSHSFVDSTVHFDRHIIAQSIHCQNLCWFRHSTHFFAEYMARFGSVSFMIWHCLKSMDRTL